MFKRVIFYIVLLWATAVRAEVYTPATVPDPKVDGQYQYVANPDALLADSTVMWLNDCAKRLDEATQVEMAVVALQSIGDADAFDFAYELFQRWGIGRANKNTGVLILFVMDSHDIRIMTGVGIEGVLTDAQCSKIIHDEMIPAFREGDYDGGLCLGALRIYEICTDGEAPEELLTIRSVTNRGKYGDEPSDTDIFALVGVMFGVAGIFFLLAYLSLYKRCPKCGKLRARSTKERVISKATYVSAGRGIRSYCCKNCGHTFDQEFVIPRRTRTTTTGHSGGGGGGFSGGSWGGGSTMGGGAGGKW